MGALLVLVHRAANFEHIHVVIVASARVSLQVKVLLYNVPYRRPAVPDVTRCTPRVSNIAYPCARICPSADVKHQPFARLLLGFAYGVAYFRVLFALVKPHVHAATVVYLNKIVVPILQICLDILLLISCQSNPQPIGLRSCIASAGVVTGIRIYAGLQPELVNIVGHRTHTVGKTLAIDDELTVFCPTVPETIVNINILIARLFQPLAYHGIGLPFYNFVTDVQCKCVP